MADGKLYGPNWDTIHNKLAFITEPTLRTLDSHPSQYGPLLPDFTKGHAMKEIMAYIQTWYKYPMKTNDTFPELKQQQTYSYLSYGMQESTTGLLPIPPGRDEFNHWTYMAYPSHWYQPDWYWDPNNPRHTYRDTIPKSKGNIIDTQLHPLAWKVVKLQYQILQIEGNHQASQLKWRTQPIDIEITSTTKDGKWTCQIQWDDVNTTDNYTTCAIFAHPIQNSNTQETEMHVMKQLAQTWSTLQEVQTKQQTTTTDIQSLKNAIQSAQNSIQAEDTKVQKNIQTIQTLQTATQGNSTRIDQALLQINHLSTPTVTQTDIDALKQTIQSMQQAASTAHTDIQNMISNAVNPLQNSISANTKQAADNKHDITRLKQAVTGETTWSVITDIFSDGASVLSIARSAKALAQANEQEFFNKIVAITRAVSNVTDTINNITQTVNNVTQSIDNVRATIDGIRQSATQTTDAINQAVQKTQQSIDSFKDKYSTEMQELNQALHATKWWGPEVESYEGMTMTVNDVLL